MTFTKEQLIARAETVLSNARTSADFHDSKPYQLMDVQLAEITLASLTAEPVGEVILGEYDHCGCHPDARVACIAADGQADWENFKDGTRLYTAQVVPDKRYQHLSELYHAQEKRLFKLAQLIKGPSFDKYAYSTSQAIDVLETAIFGEKEDKGGGCLLSGVPTAIPDAIDNDIDSDDHPLLWSYNNGWNACRDAMLQGAEPISQHPELTVWYGSMPETNGKTNWTAILHRKGEGRCLDGFTIDSSEYPGRVLYAADRVRYLIGEKAERPRILDYDGDAHSGYVKPGNSPAIPDDVRRMDWLVSKTVDVREPMVYGSHSLFWSQTITDEEDDYHATKLREQIDAVMAAENAAAPQQDKYHLNRCDAMEWLAEHHPDFPGNMAGVPMRARWCSENLFNGWRFVLLESGEWVFADCLSPCIRAEDMEGFKLPALQRFNIKQL